MSMVFGAVLGPLTLGVFLALYWWVPCGGGADRTHRRYPAFRYCYPAAPAVTTIGIVFGVTAATATGPMSTLLRTVASTALLRTSSRVTLAAGGVAVLLLTAVVVVPGGETV